MNTYKITANTAKEDSSDKETVRLLPMAETRMGSAETEYEKQSREMPIRCSETKKCRAAVLMNPDGLPKRKSVCRGYGIAAAGLAGALLVVNTAGTVSASQGPRTEEPFLSGRQDQVRIDKSWWGKDSKSDTDQEGTDLDIEALNKPVSYWDEEEILNRWDLDPDDFPSEQEEQAPDIPDEYIPYFQEVVSDAIAWYSGDTPPVGNLSKYSPRADAIRQEAAHRAEKSVQDKADRILEMSKSVISSAGSTRGGNLVSALQDGIYSRDVSAGTLVFGGISQKKEDSPDSILMLGKTENDRTNGPSSVTWFLQGRDETPGQTAADSGENSDKTDEAAELSNSQAVRESAGKEESAGQNMPVVSPTFHYLLTPPFAYDMDPGVHLSQGPDTLPLPPGVYPYMKPYKAAEKESDDEEEIPADDSGSDSCGDDFEETIADVPDSETNENTDRARRKLTVADNGIPFRDYKGSGGNSNAFYGGRKTIFIGDSRTVGMEMFCGGMPEEYWSAKNSMGYSWMVSTGIPNVEHLIDQNSDVVILMGVNDLGNVYNYIDHINMKAAEWKKLGARTFFVSVTPVDDSRSPNAKNSRIENFNAYAQENLQDVYYIDAYSRIRHSFGSPDGIHFDGATYREIYRIIEFSLYKGWYEQNGLWFYFDCGKPLTGWQYLDGQWQYLDGYGVRWVKDGRVGDMCYVPLPDFTLSGEEIIGLSF